MGEHYLSRTRLWSCFSNSHNNRTIFSTERGATSYRKPMSSFTHDCVCQTGHRIAQSTMGPDFTPPPRQFMNTGHSRTFITVTMLTGAQSEPGQIWTYGYKHCDEHCISYRSKYSCQISYHSQFRHCFYKLNYNEKLAKQVTLNTALGMFTMVYFTLC